MLNPRLTEGPIKSPLSLCLPVSLSVRQFSIFIRNGTLVFVIFGAMVDNWNI